MRNQIEAMLKAAEQETKDNLDYAAGMAEMARMILKLLDEQQAIESKIITTKTHRHASIVILKETQDH